MTGKKESGATWHPTTVVLREDIYRQALLQKIDISDACNRTLARLTGSEYHRHPREEVPAPQPVIIARVGSSTRAPGELKKSPSQKLHPVINADDPAAPARVVQAEKQKVKKVPAEPPAPVPVPSPAPVSPDEKPVGAPAAGTINAAVKKDHSASSKKRSKGDALKTFFSSKITRTDDTGDNVGKDDLYEIFIRFCRDHRITPVPERRAVTVALKNQFALTEKLVDGTPCWTGIRLK
jgi:hypothetical protein